MQWSGLKPIVAFHKQALAPMSKEDLKYAMNRA